MESEAYRNFIHGKIVAICESVLNEEIGVIAGSRRIKGLGFELFDDHDQDFMTFVGIDSETDHLPVDRERKNWSVEALERKDKEIAELEAAFKTVAFEACQKLILRFNFRN